MTIKQASAPLFASIQDGAVMGQKGGDGSGEGGGKDERGREGGRMEGERGTSVCTVTSEITIHINLSQEFF